MAGTNRREFLKRSGAGVAAAALPLRLDAAAADDALPPHRRLDLQGLHAYADQESIAAGETIRFHVSSTVPYRLSVCQLGLKVDDPAGDLVLHAFPEAPADPQPIHPGSYVHAGKGAAEAPGGLTLETWLRPWKPTAVQGILTEYEFPAACSFGLFLTAKGEVAFYLGDGGAFREDGLHVGPAVKPRRWQHVVGTWDGRTKSLWVDGERAGEWPFAGPVRRGTAALRLGAAGEEGVADRFLEGDLAMPAIYGRALSAEEVKRRFEAKALVPPESALSFWALSEENGARLADSGPAGRHGRIVNHATWMIGGPSFRSADVPRFGSYDPAADPKRGHGLRFASDDLYDCRWKPTREFALPRDAKPGVYVGRFEYELEGAARAYHVTFLVRRPPSRPKAPVLVLCSTSTWRAYSSTSFAATSPGRHQFWGTDGRPNSPGNPPAYSCYRDHAPGQPTYYLGLRVPWPSAGPYVLYSPGSVGYSHLLRAERFFHVWLEEQGIEYDLIGDLDLHRDPGQLEGYKVVVINGHSEYWSIPAYEGVDRYLRGGGNVVALSGNTMFWRVSFDSEGTVMECRKFQPDIGGRAHATIGELWHSQDGKRGSLMRECGIPAWKVLGLECVGWWGTNAKDFGVYRAEAPDHFLMKGVGLEKGATFGHAEKGVPAVGGHEADIRISTLMALTGPPPAGVAAAPEEPAGFVTLAKIVRAPFRALDYYSRWVQQKEAVIAEAIYWERPAGGRVFHAGAIAAAWAISADPKFQLLMKNVLRHFGLVIK